MEKDKKTKITHLLIVILFLSLGITGSVWAYGGGGGDRSGASDDDIGVPPPAPTKKSDIVKEYTREELEEIFSGLPADVVEQIVDRQEGKPRTPAQLNLIKSLFLSAEKFKNESEEAIWQSYEEIAVVLDKAGQNAELVLTFATGGTANIVTGTLFGAVRSGANAANEGKSTEDILQAMAVAVAVDKIMSNVSHLKKLGDRGGELVDMVSRAADLNKNPQVMKYLIKVGAKAGLYKEGEKLTKDTIGAILSYAGDQARKTTAAPTSPPMPTYVDPGYDIDRNTGQKMMK
jgi:hypothetical protein